MKELSIEEKAKRYDEAINAIKELKAKHPTAHVIKDWIKENFPELAESEDEKIRKRIIYALHGDVLEMSEIKEAVAWLEKQGEKTKLIEGFNTEFERQVSCLIASAINKDYEYTKDFVKWTSEGLLNYAKHEIEKNSMGISEATKKKLEDNLNKALEKETPESWNKFLEKQGEQKPDDKVEPKFHEGDIIIHKELGGDYIHNPHKIIQVDILDKKYRLEGGLVAHFDEQDDYELVEQKPAEWSEEDLVRIENCISLIGKTGDGEVKWLKDLKDRVLPQPKQEWSKEDENNILFLTSIIEECFKDKEKITLYGGTVCANFTKKDVIDRLKSLRPQNTWKPSDAQMASITCAVRKMKESACYDSELVSLFNDLKKLREG